MKGTKLLFLTLGICIGIDNGETMKTLCLLLSLENLKKPTDLSHDFTRNTAISATPSTLLLRFLFVVVKFLTIYKGFTLCY